MGFLTGSCFTFEGALVPLTRTLSTWLLGSPVDRFLSIMPGNGTGKMLAFFGFTLALGVVVNSTGLVINIMDRMRAGDPGEAVFSKTGLCGALFFWWSLALGVRAALGSPPAWFDAPGIGLPLLGLLLEGRLARLVNSRFGRGAREGGGGEGGGGEGGHGGGDGVAVEAVRGLVSVIESVSYFLSTSLSFLRVGAFALSHAVLSFIVFTMGDMVRQRSAAGIVWQLLLVLAGNAVILFLEGLIVAIQIVRLQYYEFLSKFLTETGIHFDPFKFRFSKERT